MMYANWVVATGAVLARNGSGAHRHQDLPVQIYVPPFQGEPHDEQGRAAWWVNCSHSSSPSRNACRACALYVRKRDGVGTQRTAEIIADFIAGMTDRFALEEHARIFDPMSRS